MTLLKKLDILSSLIDIQNTTRGGGHLVISHKYLLICWLILAPRPPMLFLHKTFPGTTDETSHYAKFHSSSCLTSWLPKTDWCETTWCSPPPPLLIIFCLVFDRPGTAGAVLQTLFWLSKKFAQPLSQLCFWRRKVQTVKNYPNSP